MVFETVGIVKNSNGAVMAGIVGAVRLDARMKNNRPDDVNQSPPACVLID